MNPFALTDGAIERRAPDAKDASHVRGTLAACQHSLRLLALRGGQRGRTTKTFPAPLCRPHSGDGAFAKYVGLKLRDAAENAVEHPSRRGAGVNVIAQ